MILETLKGYQAVEAYPEGWACVNCGDEYTEKTIDAKDFYAIHTEHGTELRNTHGTRHRVFKMCK
jgi:hypothetical protein